jgi:hypothetical protein
MASFDLPVDHTNYDQEPTDEKQIFNETRKYILNRLNRILQHTNDALTPSALSKLNTVKTKIKNVIYDLDNDFDEKITKTECELTVSTNLRELRNRNKGRELSSGCVHAIAQYYNCSNGKGLKTYNFNKRKNKIPIHAPLKAGNVQLYQQKHMDNCKYKIAREIIIQLFAHAVSEECGVTVPAIYRLGCKKDFKAVESTEYWSDDEDEDVIPAEDEDVIPAEITYYIEMDHIDGHVFNVGNDTETELVKKKLQCMHVISHIQHNDTNPGNIFINGEQVGIIDWGESTCNANEFNDVFFLDTSDPWGFGGKTKKCKTRKTKKTKKTQKTKKTKKTKRTKKTKKTKKTKNYK